MSLKNELHDMKMNDDDSITSYFVRISQLRDQIQVIEEIISENELVNIVLNGLPKTWDAFSTSMNKRKEYPTFEELWTCCAQEESRINAKEKPQNKYDDQAFTARFKNKRKFGSRRKTNQEKDILEIQCFNCQKYGHYRNQCPEIKKRKKHEASISEDSGMITFEKGNRRITFLMPHKSKRYKSSLHDEQNTDTAPPIPFRNKDTSNGVPYTKSMFLNSDYKYDEGGRRGLRYLVRVGMDEDELADEESEPTE